MKLAEVDNADVWRRNQLVNLTRIVQQRLDYLQNPRDCNTARKLVCHLNKGNSHPLMCRYLLMYNNYLFVFSVN